MVGCSNDMRDYEHFPVEGRFWSLFEKLTLLLAWYPFFYDRISSCHTRNPTGKAGYPASRISGDSVQALMFVTDSYCDRVWLSVNKWWTELGTNHWFPLSPSSCPPPPGPPPLVSGHPSPCVPPPFKIIPYIFVSFKGSKNDCPFHILQKNSP